MKRMWKDRRFWLCVLLFFGLLWLALRHEHIDAKYHPAPYIWLFHATTLFSWLAGLYCRWTGHWTPDGRKAWGCWVLLGACSQLLMWGVSAVSRVLLTASLIMGIAALLRRSN